MMKYFFFFLPSLLIAKTYTEAEFQSRLKSEIRTQVDRLKTKPVAELTKELLEKEEKLKVEELNLQKQRDTLKAAEAQLTKKVTDFEAKQKLFLGCVEKNEEESKNRIGQIVETISNMKPQKAAEVLSVQESDIAIKILQMLDSKKASKIFNFMDKEVSAKLQKQYLLMKKD